MSSDTKPVLEVSISASQEILKGQYSNAAKVVVTDSEIIIDFAFIVAETGEKKQGILTSRIIIPPNLAKKLAQSITDTLENHERKRKNNEKKTR